MADNIAKQPETGPGPHNPAKRRWQVLWWIALGVLLGVALVVIFFAYGQPELLLEQMNLRYCG